ncbi:MAG: hypothetical protein MUF42_12080 [Cytophagaceae bacterium]|jgi:hypothetical protein|nr:hypothetical protein [Cytophagaceae bacterium]
MRKTLNFISIIFLLTSSINGFANFIDKDEYTTRFVERTQSDKRFQTAIYQNQVLNESSFRKSLQSSQEKETGNYNALAEHLLKQNRERVDKFLKERAHATITALNKRIAQNKKHLKDGDFGQFDFVIDLRRKIGGSGSEFISTTVRLELNEKIKEFYLETGKAAYIVLSPFFPEQISEAAKADATRHDALNYSLFETFDGRSQLLFLQNYTNYIAKTSQLSNRNNAGVLINIESLLVHKGVSKNAQGKYERLWTVDYLDFAAYSKNLNPEVGNQLIKDIKHDRKNGRIVFSKSKEERESSLREYVSIIRWNFLCAGNLNLAQGKYKVELSQLSTSDVEGFKNAIKNPVEIDYNPSKASNLTDYGNVSPYLDKIIQEYQSRTRNESGVNIELLTTTDSNMPSGKTAMQLITEKKVPTFTILMGLHFTIASNKVWMIWDVKYSDDLSYLPKAVMEDLWKQIGKPTSLDNIAEAFYDVTDNVLLPIGDKITELVNIGFKKLCYFIDLSKELWDNGGRIPESWYKEGGWLSHGIDPIYVGIYNCVIDDIKAIAGLAKLIVYELPIAILDAVNSTMMMVFEYVTDKKYRDEINTRFGELASKTFEYTRGLVQTVAFATGYQYQIFGNITEQEYQRPELISKLITNLKSIDIKKLDADVTAAMSTPFIWMGTELEKCYGYGSSAQEKLYCSGYLGTSVALMFTGIEELAMASVAVRGAEISRVLTRTNLKSYLEKILGVSRKVYPKLDEALMALLRKFPPWASDLVSGVQSLGGKIAANGDEIWIYCANKADILLKIKNNGVSYVRNWIDELEIKIIYPRFGIEEVAMVTPDGTTKTGFFQMVQKENGEFYIKKPKVSKIINTIDELVELVDDSYKALLRRDLNESNELFAFLRNNPDKLEAWKILSNSIHSINVTAINYVDMLKGGTQLSRAPTNDYIKTWRENFPSLQGGNFNVHHSIEQQVQKKWPNLFDEAEINSFPNLRGISGEINSDVHLSRIRKEWDKFYDEFPDGVIPSKQQVLDWAKHVDDMFGQYFSPPIRKP